MLRTLSELHELPNNPIAGRKDPISLPRIFLGFNVFILGIDSAVSSEVPGPHEADWRSIISEQSEWRLTSTSPVSIVQVNSGVTQNDVAYLWFLVSTLDQWSSHSAFRVVHLRAGKNPMDVFPNSHSSPENVILPGLFLCLCNDVFVWKFMEFCAFFQTCPPPMFLVKLTSALTFATLSWLLTDIDFPILH